MTLSLTSRFVLIQLAVCFFMAIWLGDLQAQNEFSKWYFGTYAGLDFSTSPPTALANGTMIAPEGCATVSDANGNLLFYTEGSQIFNSAHLVMANGTGLNGDPSSTQSAAVIKKPGSANLYYVFTTSQYNGAYYSIVDMSLAAGMGSVTTKNNLLHASSTEKQVLIRHCNGTDVWIVGHENGTNKFWAYVLTGNGVNANPTLSALGEIPIGTADACVGYLKASPNGKLLAAAIHSNSVPSSAGTRGFYLYDFDPTNGVISNSLCLLSSPTAQRPYGIEFSPDGTKLYGSSFSGTATSGGMLYQWDVCQSSTTAIISSLYSFSVSLSTLAAIQRAVDNKLYLPTAGFVGLNVIHNPNNAGASMNFSATSVYIANKQARYGLPSWINLYVKPSPPPFTSTIACQTASFSSASVFTFSDNCSASSYSYTTFLWDFGEPNSGTANTSTLSNPIHTYASVGSYTVKLIQYSICSSDTVNSIINITTIDPPVSILGKTIFCKGEQRVLTASGANSYIWSNAATTNTIAVSPTLTTVYTVTASTASCNVRKSFTVTVKDCIGLEAIEKSTMKIFPNPFQDYLNIENPENGTISFFTLSGKCIMTIQTTAEQSKYFVEGIVQGVYLIEYKTPTGTHHELLFK